MAQQLNLTHMVDVIPANLESVSSVIGCECLLFAWNGQGVQQPFAGQLGVGRYQVAYDWDQLLQMLLQP